MSEIESSQNLMKVRKETYDRLKAHARGLFLDQGIPASEPGWILVPIGQATMDKLSEVAKRNPDVGDSDDEIVSHILDVHLTNIVSNLTKE